MDNSGVLAAFDAQLRNTTRLSVSGGRFERDGAVVRCVGAGPDDWSGIDWADLDESTADDAIAAQVRYFTGLGREFEWKYYAHDRPADLPERLLHAGFAPDPEEALMIADIANIVVGDGGWVGQAPLDHQPPDGVRLVPVTDAEQERSLVAVHRAVFGDDPWLGDEGSVSVLAMAGDLPVSGSRIDFHEGTEFASLWGGGTLEAWRGKGIYRAMVSFRARLAAERGARYLRVDALPTSRPILERLGFVTLTTTVPYTFTPR